MATQFSELPPFKFVSRWRKIATLVSFLLPLSEVKSLSPTLSNLMDCSLPGSSVHGIFQARVLEWGAIAFYVILSIKFT